MKSTRSTASNKTAAAPAAAKNISSKKEAQSINLFDRENYKWMIIGVAVMALGFILMAGGRSEDPNVFNPNEVYSPVRITIAPILIIAGFVIEIFAIFRQPKNSQS